MASHNSEYDDNYFETGSRRDIVMERMEKSREIEKGIFAGLTLNSALAIAKVHPLRWHTWCEEGKAQPLIGGDMRWIVGIVDCIESRLEQTLIESIVEKAKTDWKAAAWLLERRFRKNWGNDVVPVDVDKGGRVIFTASIGTDGTISKKLDSEMTKDLIREAVNAQLNNAAAEAKFSKDEFV
jgi:DNA-binding protein YbaB